MRPAIESEPMLVAVSIHANPLLPGWLAAMIALALIAAVSMAARILRQKQVPTRWVAILSGLRLAGIALFVVGLLQPVVGYTRTTKPRPELVVVIDTSASMG